ncbi:hypothetical protein M378DRAFT_166609 [Amanita muscaria Koide BX008]|uniref:Uncharacterized protein n=1 Tax=Amanita muscaria (strain Koide BX008) TaxID=946122 RepID=A0A0C2WXU4_AMAMK|nr:hypothetical protein M378DRAFT_166609 [Amanita muscaria Koide BX008]
MPCCFNIRIKVKLTSYVLFASCAFFSIVPPPVSACPFDATECVPRSIAFMATRHTTIR